MQTTTYVCDRCGAAIPVADRTAYQPSVGPHRHDRALDLCPACDARFRDWLARPDPTSSGAPHADSGRVLSPRPARK
jgi:hypothetical protein